MRLIVVRRNILNKGEVSLLYDLHKIRYLIHVSYGLGNSHLIRHSQNSTGSSSDLLLSKLPVLNNLASVLNLHL